MPEPMSDAEYAAQQAAAEQQRYERELAEYQRQMAAYEQQAAVVGATPQTATPGQTPPPKKRKTGLIIGLIIGVLVVCGLVAGAGVVGWKVFKDSVAGPSETLQPDADVPGSQAGHASAVEAIEAYLEDAGWDTWVYQLYNEAEGSAVYWIGPPNSEFVEQVTITQGSDGSWSVTDSGPIEYDEGAADENVDAAVATVEQFLTAVRSDRGEDAHALTTEPFSSDGASAQVSAGMFDSFEISGAVAESDGGVKVETVQVWSGNEERWVYVVVPTDQGYRIAELQPW